MFKKETEPYVIHIRKLCRDFYIPAKVYNPILDKVKREMQTVTSPPVGYESLDAYAYAKAHRQIKQIIFDKINSFS